MSSLSAEVKQVVTLPLAADGSLPLVSCVAVDQDGCLYLTDELNHRVLGFDPGGSLLWSQGTGGPGERQFKYPRGICTGWIQKAGSRTRCLAVADSWNERVSFLDPAGNPLQEWRSHGESRFGQIIDLRYVPPEEGESQGTWLLLDRTGHRLLGLTEAGAPLFSAGRELPPSVKAEWQVGSLSILRALKEPDALPEIPPRDYLYYPYRFLGQYPESLMIWEPLARTLKVSLWGSFLPIVQLLPESLEWITADSSLLLGWDPDQSTLHCFDGDGTALGPWSAEGRPLPSSASPPACWIQVDNVLRRLRLPMAVNQTARPLPLAAGLLALSAARRSETGHITPAGETIDSLVRLTDELRGMAEVHAGALRSKTPVADAGEQKLRVEALQSDLARLQGRLLDDLRPLLSPAVDWRYAAIAAGYRLQATASEPERLLARLLEPLRTGFGFFVGACDELRVSLARLPATQPFSQDTAHQALASASATLSALLGVVEWLFSNLGPAGGGAEETWRPQRWKNGFPSHGRPRGAENPAAMAIRSVRAPFQQTRLIQVTGRAGAGKVMPFCLCHGPKGLFLVSLFSGHEVQCLDGNGNVLWRLAEAGHSAGQLFQPTGVLFDRQGRVWVSEAGNRRIQVWSPPYSPGSASVIRGSSEDPLEGPVGLFQVSSGEVLIADSFTNRVWRVGADTQLSLWLGRTGTQPGELLNPVFFSGVPGDSGGAFWLVERANHRIQRFDEAGRCQTIVGRCGLDDGCLLAPRSVACLADGTLVVAEDRNPGCLVFLTEKGRVTARMAIDYVPGTLIAADDKLLVTDMLGDTIRVYARP